MLCTRDSKFFYYIHGNKYLFGSVVGMLFILPGRTHLYSKETTDSVVINYTEKLCRSVTGMLFRLSGHISL